MISSLTPRELEIAIKNGATQEELLLEYNCTQNELDDRLESLYPNKNVRRSKVRKLQSNSKSHKSKRKPDVASTEASDVVVEEISSDSVSNQADEEITTASAINQNTESTNQQSTNKPVEVEILLEAISVQREQISKQIFERSEKLNQLELQHKGYEQVRTEIRTKLKGYQDKISKLLDECTRIQKNMEEKILELNSMAVRMQELNEPINIVRAEISQLEEELKNCNVVIFAYNSGEILVNDTRIATFNGWDEVYAQLRTRDDIDDRLTFFQLKQLAKLITVTNELNASNMKFEVMFDSEVSESAYRTLT